MCKKIGRRIGTAPFFVIAGLMINQWNLPVYAANEPIDKAKAIEEITVSFSRVVEFANLLNTASVNVKDIKKYLDEHKSEFQRVQLENLTSLDEASIEKTRKALGKVMSDNKFLDSMRARKAFLKAKSGKGFIFKLQQIYEYQVRNMKAFNGFRRLYTVLEQEGFNEDKNELLKDLKWKILIEDSGVTYKDDFAFVSCSVDAEGKTKQQQKEVAGKNKLKIVRPPRIEKGYNEDGSEIDLYRLKIGLEIKKLTDEEKSKYAVESGVIVEKVREDGLADEAQLKQGDIITHVDGEPITTEKDFLKATKEPNADKIVTLKVKREDKTLDIKLELVAPIK